MNFFKSSSKTKTPPELIRSTREAIQRLDAASTGAEGRRKVSRSSYSSTAEIQKGSQGQ